jgi:hypothetical protein
MRHPCQHLHLHPPQCRVASIRSCCIRPRPCWTKAGSRTPSPWARSPDGEYIGPLGMCRRQSGKLCAKSSTRRATDAGAPFLSFASAGRLLRLSNDTIRAMSREVSGGFIQDVAVHLQSLDFRLLRLHHALVGEWSAAALRTHFRSTFSCTSRSRAPAAPTHLSP